jgi:hypothetical protein
MFILYFILFVILLLALYFYIQNLRFLHSTNQGYSSSSYLSNERKSINIYYYSLFIVFFLSLGFFLIDDIILIFIWLII